jgi:hypothetical protein
MPKSEQDFKPSSREEIKRVLENVKRTVMTPGKYSELVSPNVPVPPKTNLSAWDAAVPMRINDF